MAKDYTYGLNGVLYRDAVGTDPATTVVTNVRDVTLTNTSVRADTTSRASDLFKSEKVIILESVLTFEMLDDLNDEDGAITAFRTAFLAKAALSVFPTDGEAGTGEGINGDWNITGFTRNEPLEDVVTYSVEATPNNETREPAWETSPAP